jgi:hypothetical protein
LDFGVAKNEFSAVNSRGELFFSELEVIFIDRGGSRGEGIGVF